MVGVGCVAYPTAFKSNPTAFNDKSPKKGDVTYKNNKNEKTNTCLSTQQIYKNILNYLIV